MDENTSEFFGGLTRSSGNTEDAFKQNFIAENATVSTSPSATATQAYTPRPPPVVAMVEGAPVKCPKCGKGMVVRNGKNGEFFGCTGFKDGCKGSMNIPKPIEFITPAD